MVSVSCCPDTTLTQAAVLLQVYKTAGSVDARDGITLEPAEDLIDQIHNSTGNTFITDGNSSKT